MIGSPCDVGTSSAGTLKVTYTPAPDGTDTVTTLCSQSNPVYALNISITPICNLQSPGGGFPQICYWGSISVTSSPGAINCANAGPDISGTCTASFPAGTVVTLTQTLTNTAIGLAGCDSTSSDGSTCTVTMNGLRNLTSSPYWQP
jgi:hypothetical protein